MDLVFDHYRMNPDRYKLLFQEKENKRQNVMITLILDKIGKPIKSAVTSPSNKKTEVKLCGQEAMVSGPILTTCEHDRYEVGTTYNKEGNKDYWREGEQLHGSKCAVCTLIFSTKKNEGLIVATGTKPAFCCKNRLDQPQCHHVVCFVCFMTKMMENPVLNERASRRRS